MIYLILSQLNITLKYLYQGFRLLVLFSFVFLWVFKAEAQYIENDECVIENNTEDFSNAILFYQRMLMEDPDNAELNYNLGFCYMNTPGQRENAVEYFDKAYKLYQKKKKKYEFEAIKSGYCLAKAYQFSSQFDEAIQTYEDLKSKSKQKRLHEMIDREILACEASKKIMEHPVEISVQNLGDTINSEFSDHSPVVSADEKVLIFTSRRENKYNSELSSDGEFDENIYISNNIDGHWTIPMSIGDSINTPDHEASIGLSVDGQELYIYKSDDEGSIYVSKLQGDVWSKPKKLGPTINTRYRETHASLSADGNTLYFTSDRKGGYGGLDIYVAQRKANGEWSEAKNLGPTINTPSDERAPYIHPDGKTLYFSTKGYPGLGGFDIFKSQLTEFGTWTLPENLGYPINTADDDIFYVLSADGQRAYYSSTKEEGYGRSDIYMIGLKKAEKTKITIMTGKIYICRGELPEVSITVMDAKTDEVVGIYAPNTKTGKFLFVLNKGGYYDVVFETGGEIILTEKLHVPKDAAYQQLYKVIEIPVDPPCEEEELAIMEEQEFAGGVNIDNIDENGIVYDKHIKVENILFPYNNATEIPPNKTLDKLAQYLLDNPNAKIEIGAYADASGRAYYNYLLSLKRGNAVKNYLLKKNVKPEQLVVQGYGEENPIAINRNKDGSWNREAMRFNRRIEFRVLEQGTDTLLIKPLSNIPKEYRNPKYNKYYKKAKSNNIETKE